MRVETIYLAGGCLWGVEYFVKSLPGVISTRAGRANGTTDELDGVYDGYAECVRVEFDADAVSVSDLMGFLFEIINPYAVDYQGFDVGRKYRTGVYSTCERHLTEARAFIASRDDARRIAVEVKPLVRFVESAEKHQNHLERYPEDFYLCHIPRAVRDKYRS